MLKRVDIVIGANYGDEGKGLVTSFLSERDRTLVVRYNGGAQAGHTVYKNGKRTVFSHFGSGTHNDCGTYLSEHFIINPHAFIQEYERLSEFESNIRVYVDCKSNIAHPLDFLINRVIENARGFLRHGSCGHGIHEATERAKNKYPIFLEKYLPIHFKHREGFFLKELDDLLPYYVERMVNYNLDQSIIKYILNQYERYKKIYADYFMRFFCKVEIVHDFSELVSVHDNLVFEGAQGLRLSRKNTIEYPHLTDSYTGLENVVEILSKIKERKPQEKIAEQVNVNYVSRAYLTRHGAGKFKSNPEILKKYNISEPTNVENIYQGEMQYGSLDVDEMVRVINEDFNIIVCDSELATYLKNHKTPLCKNIYITCVDQLEQEGFEDGIDGRGYYNSSVFISSTYHKTPTIEFCELLSYLETACSFSNMFFSLSNDGKKIHRYELCEN